MMRGVKDRLLKSVGVGGLNLTARLLEQILLVPLLLTAWSAQLFGEWMLIAAVPIYLSLLDFGVVESGSNELAKRASEKDEKGVQQFFRDYSSAFLVWSIVLFGILTIAIMFSPISDWLKLEVISSGEAQMIFVLLAAGTLVSQNSLALLAGLRARQMMPQGLMVRAVGAFSRLLASFIAVALLDFGPAALAAILLVSRVGEYGWQVILLRKANLRPMFNIFRKRTEKLREFVVGGLEFMLFPLAQSLILQGTVVVVGLTYGAAAVALFTTHRTLSRLISQVVHVICVPLRAEAGLLQSDGHKTELGGILIAISRTTLWLAACLAIALYWLGKPIFAVWTSGKLTFMPSLFAILLCAAILEAIWTVTATIRMGTNRHRPLAWGYLVASLLGLTAIILAANFCTIEAVAAGIAMVEIAMICLAIPITLSLLDVSLSRFALAHLTPPIAELKMLARRFGLGRK